MQKFTTTVLGIGEPAAGVRSLRLAPPPALNFKAGQFLRLSFPAEPALLKSLTISSAPTENSYWEVTKRLTDSRFSQLFRDCQIGSIVSCLGPMGLFCYEGQPRKAAFLSGGIGITPLRSMAEYAVAQECDCDIVLLYSNRTEADIAFRGDWERLAGSRLRVVHTLTQGDSNWLGQRGRIAATMIKTEIPDFQERTFFICGPPALVSSLRECLSTELALPAAQIKSEDFDGY